MGTNRLRVAVAAGMSVAVLAMAGCGSSSSSGGSNTTKSGSDTKSGKEIHGVALLALSGPFAGIGTTDRAGIQTAVDVLKKDGVNVSMDYVDTAADPAQTTAGLSRALASGTPDFVVAGSTSGEAAASLPLLMPKKILSVAVIAGARFNNTSTYPYFFGTTLDPTDTGAGLVNKIVADHPQIKKLGILSVDIEFGHEAAGAIEAAAKKKGLEVDTEYAGLTDTDATSQLSKLAAAHVDALALTGAGPVVSAMLAGRHVAGINAPTYTDLNFENQTEGLAPDNFKGVTTQTYPWIVKGNPATQTPDYQAFLTALKPHTTHFGGGMTVVVNAYNMIMLAAAAIDKTGSSDGDGLRNTIESFKVSDVAHWVGPDYLGYSKTQHFLRATPQSFVYYPAAPLVNGFFVPPAK